MSIKGSPILARIFALRYLAQALREFGIVILRGLPSLAP
jgi:hypothetical protein